MKVALQNWLVMIPSPYLEYLQNKYIISLFIIIVAILGAKLLLFIFSRYLEKFAKKTKTKVDDLIFEHTKKPLFYLVLIYGIKFALINLEINGVVTKIINSLTALVFLFILLKIVDVVLETWGTSFAKKTKTRLDEVLLPLFHKVVKVIFVFISFIWVLDIWQINVAPYLAGVGLSGLVLGLALQDSLKNVFGGVSLLLDKTYQIGDKVKLESGTVGTIHDIGLRSTKMMTFDNEIIYIPNGYLANTRVQNYTRPSPKVRVNVLFSVAYGSNIKRVKKVVLDRLKKMKGILKDPAPTVQFLEMGDFALNCKALFWVHDWGDAWSTKLRVTEVIYNELNKKKIDIPFPTQTVYVKK